MDSNPTPLQSENFNDLENSNLRTKKKSFVSEVDPNIIKRKVQQERYIWFGVHNELLRNKNIIKIIQKCNDTSIPIESASIHLDKFKVGFNRNRVFIEYNENSVIFFKLYLITKEQFMDILRTYYSCKDKIKEEQENILKKLNKINDEFDLNLYLNEPNLFYNIIKYVGNLDGIKILTITSKKKEIIPPEPDFLRIIYSGLKKSFQPYNEYLIIYYIYLLDGVRNYYNIKQLSEVFLQNKIENSSSVSSETNLTIGETTKQNKYLGILQQNTLDNLNNTPSQPIKKNDNDTIKCSTCNGSPFMGTPEKEQLNQYSYIFDLHHLPIFDEITGEFFWSNNEANWKIARDSIIKSEEANNGKSMSIFHGSLVSLSQSFTVKKDDNKDIDDAVDINSGTFIEELNNILKEIN
jgi:hypothetical protein